MEIHKMSDTDEQGPRGMARAVCGTAGGAATLVRLSAGIAVVACLCWFVKDLVGIRKKRKKTRSGRL